MASQKIKNIKQQSSGETDEEDAFTNLQIGKSSVRNLSHLTMILGTFCSGLLIATKLVLPATVTI